MVIIVIAAIGFVGYRVIKNQGSDKKTSTILSSNASPEDKAIAAGKSLSNNKCQGTGETTFTHLPMNAGDFSLLIPYGLMVGGHVTPIDHQYFSPTVFNSAKDTYPVYAMADSQITDIEVHPPENGSNGRIRMVFTVSCTFFYYYDLVTSVEPGIDSTHLPVKVKAGQLIGSIGGQTLDFAVWNTKKPLSGFINPASYDGEPWKIYTDNPFPYYTPELRKIVESKNPRIVEPVEGKIDYDIDGKLIGNWFEQGTGGYTGSGEGRDRNYSKTHLAFAPDLYDPSYFIISIGSLYSYDNERYMQHVTATNSPNPAEVGVNTLVKYDLVNWSYTKPGGGAWDNMSVVKGVKVKAQSDIFGCAIAQLTDAGTLKFEVFVGKKCSSVSSFDSSAKTYTR
jgi:hypothetical protein